MLATSERKVSQGVFTFRNGKGTSIRDLNAESQREEKVIILKIEGKGSGKGNLDPIRSPSPCR